jgi:hypothetical protein
MNFAYQNFCRELREREHAHSAANQKRLVVGGITAQPLEKADSSLRAE